MTIFTFQLSEIIYFTVSEFIPAGPALNGLKTAAASGCEAGSKKTKVSLRAVCTNPVPNQFAGIYPANHAGFMQRDTRMRRTI